MALKEKREHALKYPNYQYTPRKPSEKKRRMTKKKAAKLQLAGVSSSNVSSLGSDAESSFAHVEYDVEAAIDDKVSQHVNQLEAEVTAAIDDGSQFFDFSAFD